jgi:hypothetical protein
MPRLALLSLLALAGCTIIGPDEYGTGGVSLSVSAPVVVIDNARAEPIRYMLIENNTAAMIDIPPCRDWSPRLPTIPSNERDSVHFSEIMGYEEEATEGWLIWCGTRSHIGDHESFPLD